MYSYILKICVLPLNHKRETISHSPKLITELYIFSMHLPHNHHRQKNTNSIPNRNHCVCCCRRRAIRAIVVTRSWLWSRSPHLCGLFEKVRPRTCRLVGAGSTLQRPGSATAAGHLPPTLGEAQPSKCHHEGPPTTVYILPVIVITPLIVIPIHIFYQPLPLPSHFFHAQLSQCSAHYLLGEAGYKSE